MLSQLLTYSFITSRIGYIESELHKNHKEKAQLNVFLKAPFGFGKTSEIMELVENGYAHICLEHTEAGLIGSARGDYYYRGEITEGANKLFIIDEYSVFEDKARRHLLSVMSHGFTKRTLMTFAKKRFEDRGDGWQVTIDTNGITLKIRTSVALSTAVLTKGVDEITEMIMSRCFNLNYLFSKEDAIEVLLGEKPVEKPNIRDVDYIDKIILPENLGKELVKGLDKLTLVPEEYGGYYMRAYWDLAKIASALAVLDNRTEIKREDIEEAYRYYPLHSLGFVGNKLSKKELEVYRACTCKTAKEIEKETGIPERTVYRILSRLENVGIVNKIEYSNKVIYCQVVEL